ncbi:hypothetical protein [Micromonospora sp. NPDC023888]|uniref:hypothetical protein n=1 Tax=Micromonospora sp. NPDC023888 TaxID=3155607 RepID=UPI0033CA51C9
MEVAAARKSRLINVLRQREVSETHDNSQQPLVQDTKSLDSNASRRHRSVSIHRIEPL